MDGPGLLIGFKESVWEEMKLASLGSTVRECDHPATLVGDNIEGIGGKNGRDTRTDLRCVHT